MAKPISVEPSQDWEGDDGPWSTFAIQVGNPPQPLRVLASTNVPETWVILDVGCIESNTSKCAKARGNLYYQDHSTTWDDLGVYSLGAESNLGYNNNADNGDYGFDTIALGYNGSGGISLDHQVIAGIATGDFPLGFLGLAPWPVNLSLTASTLSSPSYISNLKNQSKIPSLSFGYSAGAPYRLQKFQGTLTLGGYDSSRCAPNGISFPFNVDRSRTLVAGLQSIEFSDSSTKAKDLLSEGILIFVDSTVPHIWLPVSACREFENAFGITYDQQTELYLVNDTLHETILAQNATVTFVIGNGLAGEDKVRITFPYPSFDLETSYDILNGTTRRYFPLRRAANETQYTLGRTFLQESYLIVDYERLNFSLSQATFIENSEPNLVPILSKDDISQNITKIGQGSPKFSHKLSSGAVAGIVVAIVLGILIGAAIFIIGRWRAHNGQKNNREELEGLSGKPELDGKGTTFMPQIQRAEIEGMHGGFEMEGSRGGVEMNGMNAAVELEAPVARPVELPSLDPGDSVIPSPRILPLKHPQSYAAEKVKLQSSSPKHPQLPPPWSPSSFWRSSNLRPSQPTPSSDTEIGKLGKSKNPEESKTQRGAREHGLIEEGDGRTTRKLSELTD